MNSVQTKKICLLGAVSVGKTSLVRRFVYSTFSDKYHSTIGVKIDKKSVSVHSQDIDLLIWDIQGEDRYRKVMMPFLSGMSGYFLVVDTTSAISAHIALKLHEQVERKFPQLPFVLICNKCDLPEDPGVPDCIRKLSLSACTSINTSALRGDGVEDAFLSLASAISLQSKVG